MSQLHTGFLSGRQDAEDAKKGALGIVNHGLAWRSWRLGGSNDFGSRVWVLLLWVGLLCCAVAAAGGGTSAVLKQLDDEAFEVRERATEALLSDESLTEAQLLELMRGATTAEQRHRLLAVARHHTLRRARLADFPEDEAASLGISHDAISRHNDPSRQAGAVRVVLPLPGFPGYNHLRAGDLIVALDGKPFPADLSREFFAATIRGMKPGQQVTMKVQRGDREFDAKVTLASAKALEAMYSQTSIELTFRYATIWREARERYIGVMGDIPTLSPADAEEAAE